MPSFPNSASTGLFYKHYDERPRDWESVTDMYEYEDGGRDFNERTTSPAREWEIDYGPLRKSQSDQFDTFWETYRLSGTFDFVDKYGVTWNGVRIKSYSRSHPEHRSWRKTVSFVLVKY